MVKNSIQTKVWGFLWLLVAISPNFLLVLDSADAQHVGLVEACALALAFWFFLYLLINNVFLFACVGFIFAWWWWPDFYLRLNYRTTITQTLIGALMSSNWIELNDLFRTYGWMQIILTVLFPGFTIAFLFIPVDHIHIDRRIRVVGLVGIFAILVFAYYLSSDDESGVKSDLYGAENNLFIKKWQSIYPLSAPINFTYWKFNQEIMEKARGSLKKFSIDEAALKNKQENNISTVVIVIGESSRADRWQLYGAGRKTNPLLSSREGLIKFNDVVSVSLATRTAVPALVSRVPVLKMDGTAEKFAEPSILKAFELYGYSTYWISNQGSSGYYENPVAFYAKDAMDAKFYNVTTYGVEGTYDGALINPFERVLENNNKKKLIFIHTMGSHFNYAHRYPKEFDFFVPSMHKDVVYERNGEGANEIELNNAYDNTIRYTDFILDRVISMVEKRNENSMVVYISDHAEDIYDRGCGYADVARRSASAYRVPLLFWFNGDIEKIPAVENLKNNSNAKFTSAALPQTIMDLAGVKVEGQRSASMVDLIDANLQKRFVFTESGTVDYDAAKKRNLCYLRR